MHSPRLTLAGALVAVSCLALVGCSNPFAEKPGVLPPPDPNASSRMLTQGETESLLPSGASLPEGWNPAARNLLRPVRGHDVVRPARCQALQNGADLAFLRANRKSYTTYANRSTGSLLGVGIASLPGNPKGFARFRSLVKSCRSFTSSSKGRTTHVTAKRLRVPALTKDDLRVRFRIQSSGLAVTYDLVRAKVGHNVVHIDMLRPARLPADTEPLEIFAQRVMLNLSY